jgi:hypothetical protein
MINRYKDYTNINSKGHDRLKRQATTMSIALYFFLVALFLCGVLITIR